MRLHLRIGQFVEMNQRHRVRLNVIGDDEFQPRQPNAVIGNGREAERIFGIADVHQNFRVRLGKLIEGQFGNLEWESPFIHVADLAFGARNGDFLAGLERARRILASNDGRDAEFAGDDRGMAGAPALIGHNGGGFLHDGFPIGIGLVRHENFSVLEFAHAMRVKNEARFARPDRFANAVPADQPLPGRFQSIGLKNQLLLSRLNRFRAGLNDEQLSR